MKTKELIEKYGIENILVIIDIRPTRNMIGISYTLSSDTSVPIPCKFIENRYEIKDNYKFTVQPIDPYSESYGKRHFYQSDFDLLVRNKQAYVLIDSFKL